MTRLVANALQGFPDYYYVAACGGFKEGTKTKSLTHLDALSPGKPFPNQLEDYWRQVRLDLTAGDAKARVRLMKELRSAQRHFAMKRYEQMGNAVSPCVSAAVGVLL